MSFQEKSAWLQLLAVTAVYGAYFVLVFSQVGTIPVEAIPYQVGMFVTVVVLVVLMVAGYIAIAVASRSLDDSSDERDRSFERFGEYVGGFVLGLFTLTGLGLAMFNTAHFWIANAALLGMVLSELVSNAVKVVLYRRGYLSW